MNINFNIEENSDEEIKEDCYIGVDESGKGDFFGPLVIAGVAVNPQLKKLFF